MANTDHIGPVGKRVAPDDASALKALFAEQRARLEVVRANQIWEWFGGAPSDFGSPKCVLHGVYLQIAFIGLLALALVVAGFTRGPVLWAIAGLAVACLLVRDLVLGVPTRANLRFYRSAELCPATPVAMAPAADDEADDVVRCAAVLVAPGVDDPAALQRLLAAGDRLRRIVLGAESAPASLVAFVDEIRRGIAAGDHDGSRIQVPSEFDGQGLALEVGRVKAAPVQMPNGRFSSRLWFLLVDPGSSAAGHSKVVQGSLWGEACASLCTALPMTEGR